MALCWLAEEKQASAYTAEGTRGGRQETRRQREKEVKLPFYSCGLAHGEGDRWLKSLSVLVMGTEDCPDVSTADLDTHVWGSRGEVPVVSRPLGFTPFMISAAEEQRSLGGRSRCGLSLGLAEREDPAEPPRRAFSGRGSPGPAGQEEAQSHVPSVFKHSGEAPAAGHLP